MDENIRSLFPILKETVYLNCAAVGPLPSKTIEAVNKQLADVSLHGSTNYPDWVNTKDRARGLIAAMLCVRPEQIAFMRNTSDGFATVANGVRWERGDNIVTFAQEFPANFYPWRRIRDTYGVDLKLCPERNGRIDIDEFIGLIDHNTKVVSISAVQFSTGFRADLERIGNAARKADALFCVDIIQAFGTMPIDLPSQYIDVASSASHKWLLSPEGCGFLFLSDRARERIEPTLVGWISVLDPWDFSDYEQAYKPNALAWETGTGTSSLFYGLEQSLKLINEIGEAKIENHLEELSDHLCEILPRERYEIISSRMNGEKSQIVCLVNKKGLSSNDVFRELEKNNVVISARGPRIRISPHFFNDHSDIARLVEKLP
ncbi:MAG: aminotransferase class V-fold PLP-dependent enzyme [Pyrinomonadaceae bacterium]